MFATMKNVSVGAAGVCITVLLNKETSGVIDMPSSGLMAIDSHLTITWKTTWPPWRRTQSKHIQTERYRVTWRVICHSPACVCWRFVNTAAFSIEVLAVAGDISLLPQGSHLLDMDMSWRTLCLKAARFHICHLRHVLNIPPSNLPIRWGEVNLPSWMHCFNQHELSCRFSLG